MSDRGTSFYTPSSKNGTARPSASPAQSLWSLGHSWGYGGQKKYSCDLYTVDRMLSWILTFTFWHVYVLWLGVYWWKRDVRATLDVTSECYTTWRQICPTKDKISSHGSFMWMRILPSAYRNTITRIRFDASGYFSSSAIPLCAFGHVQFAIR